MTVAAPSDKRFRRAHVKPQRKRGRRSVRWRVINSAVLIAVMSYAGYRAAAAFESSALFHVTRIHVRGNSRLSAGEVVGLLEGLKGRNILSVELGELRQRLLKSTWVENAAVRRLLPSTIEVVVFERQPFGISRIGDNLYLVDPHGVLIDEYGPTYADIDLPIIRGLADPSGTDGLVIDADRVGLAARLLSSLSRGDIADRISEVDVTEPHGATVILKGDTAVIKLGHEDFLERLQSYLELSSALREQIPDIDYVDLRFDRRVYVRAVGPRARRAVTPAVGTARTR